mmetsp:Transcript_5276/g.13336  ORF Transcript_5276/g.13336 Transcript_5276/m.13336 type:complete len:225 (+) Transcript_5276:5144-5818(+)
MRCTRTTRTRSSCGSKSESGGSPSNRLYQDQESPGWTTRPCPTAPRRRGTASREECCPDRTAAPAAITITPPGITCWEPHPQIMMVSGGPGRAKTNQRTRRTKKGSARELLRRRGASARTSNGASGRANPQRARLLLKRRAVKKMIRRGPACRSSFMYRIAVAPRVAAARTQTTAGLRPAAAGTVGAATATRAATPAATSRFWSRPRGPRAWRAARRSWKSRPG